MPAASTAVAVATWLASPSLALAEPGATIEPLLAVARELEPGTETAEPAEHEPGTETAEPETAEPEPGTETERAFADALHLDAGATCLEHDRLSEQVVTWLELDEIDPRLTVVVVGHPTEARSLRFTLRDRGEVIAERAFTPGPSRCDDLHAVVALAIALAVDATVLESVGIAPAAPPLAAAAAAAAPEPTPIAVPEPALAPTPGLDLSPPPEPPWRLRAHAGGLVTLNVPPTIGGGLELGVEASWRERIDLQLGAMAATAGAQPVEDATISIALFAARADLCAGPSLARVRPRACLGALAGSAIAQGRGFRQDGRSSLPWLAVTLGGDVRVAMSRRVALSFGLDGVVNVVRPVFTVREELQVRQLRDLPRFGATLGVGLVVGLR